MDCLIFVSKSGRSGITGAILVKILEYFDQIQLYDSHLAGLIPMLIVDGHLFLLSATMIMNGESVLEFHMKLSCDKSQMNLSRMVNERLSGWK